MRKFIALSLLTFLCFSGVFAVYTDKTFLMPRSQGIDLPMEYTTWHRIIHHSSNAKYNGGLQAVGFYQNSTNKSDLGNYFGFKQNGTIYNQIGVSQTTANDVKYPAGFVLNTNDIIHDWSYVDHDTTNRVAKITGSYTFKPEQEVYGAKLYFHQDLDKILDGLFFRANAPIVSVRNDINLTLKDATKLKQQLPVDDVLTGAEVSILDYLAGRVENTDVYNKQAALKYAKLTTGSHSSTGIADIDLSLGYTFMEHKHFRGAFLIDMIIPTGKTPKGEFIFEPVHGNGHHWGIGCGLDFVINLYKGEDKSLDIMFVGKYNYLFEGIEKRTLNFKASNGTYSPANQYFQAGEALKTGVFPMANILTQDLRVTPASVFDGIAALALNWKGFTLDLGYNLFAKAVEHVSLRNAWENDKYAEANWAYDTANAFDINDYGNAVADAKAYSYDGSGASDTNPVNAAIQLNMLNLDHAKTPAQLTNKLYAGLGYIFRRNTYPILIGIGGDYEWASKNSALENWAVWGKLGFSW